jgi:hypothetical protein
MKQINQLLILLLGTVLFVGCKKDEVKLTPLASLNVSNFVVGGKTVRLGSNKSDSAVNMNFKQFGLIAGNSSVYLWPTGDSAHPYYNKTVSTNNGDVYSLFLAGNAATQIDTILVKENIPYRTDSTAGIRFINLSPNSSPLNIVRKKTPTVNEVTGLSYKQMTSFMSYPGLYNSADTFLVRDAAGTQLAQFNFTTATQPRFANVTLVIRGLVGSSPAIGVTRVNNDR